MYDSDDIVKARAKLLDDQRLVLQDRDERDRPVFDRSVVGRPALPVLSWSKVPQLLAECGAPVPLTRWKMNDIPVTPTTVTIVSWINDIAVGSPTKSGVMLMGNTSTGKTTLSVISMRMAVRRDLTVRFLGYEQFVAFFQNKLELSKNADRFEDFADRMDAWHHQMWLLRNVYDIVVLDDVGRTDVPNFFKGEVHSLMRARFDAGKHTIVTSNLTTPQLAAWDDRMNDFVQREYHVFVFGRDDKVV